MTTAYLTVDDAPTEALPAKLDVLRDRDVPAVFFCEGRRLDDHAEHARRAVEAGYHLGNHAYSHTHASELTGPAFREEVAQTEALLDDVYEAADATRPATVFRFPYGDRGGDAAEEFQAVLADHGFQRPDPAAFAYDWYESDHGEFLDWHWTVHFDDWSTDTQAALRENVADRADRIESTSADLVLFHDGGNDTAQFEALLDAMADRGVSWADPLDLVE